MMAALAAGGSVPRFGCPIVLPFQRLTRRETGG